LFQVRQALAIFFAELLGLLALFRRPLVELVLLLEIAHVSSQIVAFVRGVQTIHNLPAQGTRDIDSDLGELHLPRQGLLEQTVIGRFRFTRSLGVKRRGE
jgi:hypothetical protein